MIFTRRFGALAARRTFPHIDETPQEQILDLPSAETETEAERSDIQSAA
ncbi:MAG TPA: hypothetical protein VFD59_13440 [Nocardioidaceae bacterium]|nr:hypothetical protein [Nocardioidaceae bacterium]